MQFLTPEPSQAAEEHLKKNGPWHQSHHSEMKKDMVYISEVSAERQSLMKQLK